MLNRSIFGQEDWLHFYTADDERIWSYRVGSPPNNRWTLRGLDGLVLREYASDNSGWRVVSDYIYREGVLLAAVDAGQGATQARHFHLDHLGTVRAITNPSGARTSYHAYYPFGEEATLSTQDTERTRFTGHETDFNAQFGSAQQDDLTYMHARHFSAVTGRFLSTDPLGGDPFVPQSLNLFGYVAGRPLVFFDPRGMQAVEPTAPTYTGYISVLGLFGDPVSGFFGNPADNPLRPPRFTRDGLARRPVREVNCTIPDAPGGVDLGSNVSAISSARTRAVILFGPSAGSLAIMGHLSALSRPGGPWDFKRLGARGQLRHEAFGNFHFGAVWGAAGLPLHLGLRGAGFVHTSPATGRGHWLGFPPYGDDPRDQANIEAGFRWQRECR